MKYKVITRKNPRTKETKYYPTSVSPSAVSLSQIASRIEAVSSLSRGDIMNVLDNLQRIAADELTRGNSVRLGLLGSFRTSINGTPADTAELVTDANIRRVRIVFTPSSEMKGKLRTHALSFERAAANQP